MKSSGATRFCKICFKEINDDSLYALHSEEKICAECFAHMEAGMQKIKLDAWRGYYLYPYNETLRKMIYNFKGCYDYELKETFLSRQKAYLRFLFKDFVIVPAPSHQSHDERRGYNHVIEIFGELKLPIIPAIKKEKDIKQSDLHYEERKKIGSILSVSGLEKLHGKKILFVDDILTSGSTARACLSLLEKAHPKCLRFLVLCRVEQKKEKTSIISKITAKTRLFFDNLTKQKPND